jgi:hypothetical protein
VNLEVAEIFLDGVELDAPAPGPRRRNFHIVDRDTGDWVGGSLYDSEEAAARDLERVQAELEAPLTEAEEAKALHELGNFLRALEQAQVADDLEIMESMLSTLKRPSPRPSSDRLSAMRVQLQERLATIVAELRPKPYCPCGSGRLFADCHALNLDALALAASAPCPCLSGKRYENCHGLR